MFQSKLRMISKGEVAEHKEIGQDIIKVVPIELFPMIDGVLADDLTKIHGSGINHKGTEWVSKINYSNTIDAEWLRTTNRRTSPDVRRGEQVYIFQYGDTDKYYWLAAGRDDELRRLETVLYAWSDIPEDDVEEQLDVTNTYNLKISTHEGLVEFNSCKRNGESFQYRFKLDTKNSTVTITDDKDNFIHLNSPEKLWHFNNTDGTYVKLDKKNIRFHAPDSIFGEAVKSIDFKCTDFKLNASNSINMSTKSCTISASASMTIDSPVTNITGVLNVGKSLVVTEGMMAASGNIKNIESDNIKAKNATFDSHGKH